MSLSILSSIEFAVYGTSTTIDVWLCGAKYSLLFFGSYNLVKDKFLDGKYIEALSDIRFLFINKTHNFNDLNDNSEIIFCKS